MIQNTYDPNRLTWQRAYRHIFEWGETFTIRGVKRKCVVIARKRGGKSLPAVFRNDGQALALIRQRVAKGTVINADESNAWNDLHARFEMKRINHEQVYNLEGACTNGAEGYFSCLRRPISFA